MMQTYCGYQINTDVRFNDRSMRFDATSHVCRVDLLVPIGYLSGWTRNHDTSQGAENAALALGKCAVDAQVASDEFLPMRWN
jgi:hypothetical protein